MAEKQKIIEAEDVDVCGYGIFWLLNIIEFCLFRSFSARS